MTTLTGNAPPTVPSDVTLDDLYADPFPIYRQLHEQAPVHWFPEIGRYLVIGFDACKEVEADPVVFSSDDPGSLQRRSMGHSMIRKDGDDHDRERRSFGSVLKPKSITRNWDEVFADTTAQAVERFRALGPGADFHTEFAAPLAGENLRRIIGFDNATADDLQRWSQDLIDGAGNYADDPSIWDRCDRSSHEIDEAIAEARSGLLSTPNATLLSHVLNAGLPLATVCANIKLAVSGGLNEPRDLMGTIVWALATHPEQRDLVLAEPQRWSDVFDEAARWVAPLAMYVRYTTADAVIDGVRIPENSGVAVVVGAANRDPARFDDPDRFDITRDKQPHLAFGSGPHFCAGSWAARAMVAKHAIPTFFDEFPDAHLDPNNPPRAGGWVFRGPLRLPLRWTD